MRLCNITEVEAFKDILAKTRGDVWIESPYGDKYNLKSALSQYIAIGQLLSTEGSTLELFCSDRNDEILFYKFFNDNPDTI